MSGESTEGEARDAREAREARAKGVEGALIRFLAPAHKSRPRLLLMSLLLITWIAILIGMYLSTAHRPVAPSSASSTLAMAFGR